MQGATNFGDEKITNTTNNNDKVEIYMKNKSQMHFILINL